ncbi:MULTISPECIES: hypothetical protein [unclassified Pseudomonas]|uniref:hypothetical protein n=1 Tax=unclassified Pseudomonas TaxID=196821 RepID=UPI002449EB12|nr:MULTISPECIES: hypothetical protein [unclassified Pseudomonas]MDG9928491.1 hypothetical protein [Pseudomonas sp. GD04042]MDH0482661.1 hypothetical protein [Pseudomonas sp. GD04015]MDH0604637.1 hypothetical protein [Pseudomonas sp. GD03869]
MSRRKPYNHRARLERYYGSMLRNHHVAVIDSEAAQLQTMINWKHASLITSNSRQAIAEALCDIPHRWCIYLAALCCDQRGERYMKSTEVAPHGVHLAKALSEIIETYGVQLRDGCNPKHRPALAWIAIPDDVTLDEAQAALIFDAFGAWPTAAAA